MKLHLALESGMTPTARSEHTHTAYRTKSARSNRLLAALVPATRPMSDRSPLSRALILSLLARGCVEKNPGPPKPRSRAKKVSVDDAVVDAPRPAAPKRDRRRPFADDAVADAPRPEAPTQDRGRDPTVRTPSVPTAPASSSTVPASSAQPAPLRPPAFSTRPNQPRLSGGKRSRRRSISMGRVPGGTLLHPLRQGMANPSQHACALAAVVNALVASLYYVKDCCLPPYLLQLHSDPAAAAAAAAQLRIRDSTIDEAWSTLVSANAPMREFEHDYLRVHICSSRPPLNTFTHSAHAVPIPSNRRHDPAVVLASTVAQSIETTGRIYSALPTGDAYLVHTDPSIGFTHFPEQHLPLVNRLWRISAIIVRHPERFHFVTLTRRGNAVFLLDDDKPPLRLGTPFSEQPYGLAFYLQRPVAILAVAYPDGPSYVQPTIPQRATTTTALPSFAEISMASPADLAAAAAADIPLPAPSPKTRSRPTTPPRPTPAADQDDDDAHVLLPQRELGARAYRLVLQFVHSHVGVELNEIPDEYEVRRSEGSDVGQAREESFA
jgi:hypothetical protein